MLVLSRKVGERIVIGNNIVVTVIAVNGQQVRLGIEAPSAVPVWREELLGASGTSAGRAAQSPRRDVPLAEVPC